MDYIPQRQGMVSGQDQAAKHKYRLYTGASGHTWLVADIPNCADHVYVSADPKENVPGYQGFRGYAGSILRFELVDKGKDGDEAIDLTGPWHTNSEAFYQDTGIDIRDKCLTFVVVSKDHIHEGGHFWGVLKDVVYKDPDGGIIGMFNRGDVIASIWATKLGKAVYRVSISQGGGCGGWYPKHQWVAEDGLPALKPHAGTSDLSPEQQRIVEA